ncbi:hypothetical protein JF544_13925 [Halobacillus kuroshimensis]|uniref:Uncharacterized protein n=1 Tax=Halobacillus kuroshimensis TaxID=302481 RepID=A0ABS3DYG6_9BACI|nr:hypothetical protein [Halobacillus kuroshimensis]MBN8236361.1 hypothetical protein [Halobacillus kuroshimensis]
MENEPDCPSGGSYTDYGRLSIFFVDDKMDGERAKLKSIDRSKTIMEGAGFQSIET